MFFMVLANRAPAPGTSRERRTTDPPAGTGEWGSRRAGAAIGGIIAAKGRCPLRSRTLCRARDRSP